MVGEDALPECPKRLVRSHLAEFGQGAPCPYIVADQGVGRRQIGERRRQRMQADRLVQPADRFVALAKFQISDTDPIEPVGEDGFAGTYAPGESESVKREPETIFGAVEGILGEAEFRMCRRETRIDLDRR